MTLVRRVLAREEIDYERWWLLVAASVVALLVVTGGSPAGAFAVCPFKSATGAPCPGCGSLRTLDALVHGDLLRAVRMNPLTALALGAAAAWLGQAGLAMLLAGPRWRLEWTDRDLSRLRWIAALAVASTWVFLVFDGR
jgi:hypothetical protein